MDASWKKSIVVLLSITAGSACERAGGLGTSAAALGSMSGAAGQLPAFYDGRSFTVNMKEMPDGASETTIAHNGSIDEI